VPVVVFTDSHSDTFAHQRLDHRALMTPVTKWSVKLTVENAVDTLDRALAIAVAPPAGPVHLDCPGDVAALEISACCLPAGPAPAGEFPATATDRSGPLAADLERARKPLLIVGLGARGVQDPPAIRRFCERHGVPAMVTYKAKGVVPDDHPLFAGVFTNATLEQPLIDECDLLIGLGLDPVELIPRPWRGEHRIVYLGPFAVETRHVPFAAQRVDTIAVSVEYLESHLGRSEWRIDRVQTVLRDQRRRVAGASDGFTAQGVVRVAADRLASSARVTVDAGAHMFPATMFWPACRPADMLISNGLSTMGFALPAAIGAALVDRGRPVVALTGDGGLLMSAAELLTAVRERLNVVVIVFSDGSLSLIEVKQQQRHFDASGVALGTIRWPALAESFGAAASCATSDAELARCLDQAMSHRGPTLVEARIDRSNYGRMLAAIRG
jgi:acetolactate synthase I/II/III large subunit